MTTLIVATQVCWQKSYLSILGQEITATATYSTVRISESNWLVVLTIFTQSSNDLTHLSGTVVAHPAYAPCELYRLLHTNPTLFQSVEKWQSISTYLISRWTGRSDIAISYSEASWSGLLNFRSRTWDMSLLHLLRLSDRKLPPLADSSKSYTGLSCEYAKRWPELQFVPLFLGIGDGAAANMGSKCVDHS